MRTCFRKRHFVPIPRIMSIRKYWKKRVRISEQQVECECNETARPLKNQKSIKKKLKVRTCSRKGHCVPSPDTTWVLSYPTRSQHNHGFGSASSRWSANAIETARPLIKDTQEISLTQWNWEHIFKNDTLFQFHASCRYENMGKTSYDQRAAGRVWM